MPKILPVCYFAKPYTWLFTKGKRSRILALSLIFTFYFDFWVIPVVPGAYAAFYTQKLLQVGSGVYLGRQGLNLGWPLYSCSSPESCHYCFGNIPLRNLSLICPLSSSISSSSAILKRRPNLASLPPLLCFRIWTLKQTLTLNSKTLQFLSALGLFGMVL